MIKSWMAYDVSELEKKKVLSEAKTLYKSKVLNEDQWIQITHDYASKLYSPTLFMRILFFILAYIGMTTVMGPLGLAFSSLDLFGYQMLSLFIGVLFLFFTEKVLIKEKKHYKSGLTEAGLFTGLSFIGFGLLGSGPDMIIVYPLVLFVLAVIATIRYLNLITLVLAVVFLGWIVFQLLNEIGVYGKAFMPFVFMLVFSMLYLFSNKLQDKFDSIIFKDYFIILKALSLIIVYASGNYFVVRELSIELMDLSLEEHQDIPFAFVFYLFTALIPVAYVFWGIKQKSILFIRLGLLITALSIITFKYYYSLGFPVFTITLSGGILIVVALVFFNYFKQIRYGFTRKLLLQDKWSSQDLTAIISSQTLGVNKMDAGTTGEVFKGGDFGGGGASSGW